VPVLLQKGSSKIAIYGLGAIKDERLHDMFVKGQIQFVRPNENPEEWFNIFVIHQNRTAHGKKNYIPEGFLPTFLDLVIWGHEHESRIRPEYNSLQTFYVTQPGSSVATSLSESETVQKHCAILKIFKKNFKLIPVPLRTVRPFALDTLVLNDHNLSHTDKNIEVKIEQILIKKVDQMIAECEKNSYFCEKRPKKPLIRLKVDYTDFETINENRFAQKMLSKVANPRNILQFIKKTEKAEEGKLDIEAVKHLRMHGGTDQLDVLKVQDLVGKYFEKADEKNQLSALTVKGLSDAIQEYIEKDEKDAVADLVDFQVIKIQKYLKTKKCSNDIQLNDEMKKFQQMRISKQEEEDSEIKKMFEKSSTKHTNNKTTHHESDQDDSDDEHLEKGSKKNIDDDDDEIPARPTRGRGSRGGGSRGRGVRGRGTTTKVQSKLELTSSSKPPFKTQTNAAKRFDDSDDDIITLDNDENSKSSMTSKKTNISSLRTTTSQRRPRLAYEDDDDEDEEFNTKDSKKTKISNFPGTSKTATTQSSTNSKKVNYQDSDEEVTPSFSVFKRVAKK
jgi:double-strand break repair protein MRE11